MVVLIMVLDWKNVVAAGSSALLPLLPPRDDIDLRKEPAVENELEGYYQFVTNHKRMSCLPIL